MIAKSTGLALSFALSIALVATAATRAPQHTPTEHVAGAALGLFATDPDYDYGHLLDELVHRGATDVLVVDVWIQDDVTSSSLRRDRERSPSAETVSRTMQQATARGLRVGWMPIVTVERRERGEWRGALRPDDEAAWFDTYAALLRAGAERVERAGAHRVVVGSELTSLQRAPQWRQLIADTRDSFGGTLTYAANWDAYDDVPFWDALDEVGVSAYFPLAEPGQSAPSQTEAAERLRAPLAALEHFGAVQGRPVVVLEVGFPAHSRAAHTPWDETVDTALDAPLQARLLHAFCTAESETALGGFYVWNWFGVGGPRDAGYVLRGKPGANAFESCMRNVNRQHRGPQ